MILALLAFASVISAFAMLMVAIFVRSGPAMIRVAPLVRPPLFVVTLVLGGLSLCGEVSGPQIAVLAVTGFFVLLALAGNPSTMFRALDDPLGVPAAQASLAPRAQILGVEIDGVARAWLLDTVAHHHLVNDRVGGHAVLVSYCPLCKSGVAYDTRDGAGRLRFRVAGFWRHNMMMRDLETGTVWQQSTGEPEAGPRRVPLAMLLVELTTWEEWRREHPETTIVVEPPRPRVDYRRLLPVATLFEKGPRLIAAMPNRGPRDARLPGIEEVVSVTVAGAVRAYPCRVVAERGVVLDEVGGRRVALLHDAGSGRIRAFALPASSPVVALEPDGMLRGDPDRSWDARGRAGDGGEPLEPIAVKRELWHSWSEFHPNADLYVG